MQRTFNFTNRKKIEKSHATFSMNDGGNGPPEFSVVWNIDPSQYPENASLYVEAYYKETRQRFNFGTVAKITPPLRCVVDRLDLSGPTLFRVLIVDESGAHGKLLGSGDQFRANIDDEDQNKSSIITVRKCPLGPLPWKMNFVSGEPPELIVNSLIPNAIDRIRNDSVFQSLVLPAVLREVLMYYAWSDEDRSDEHVERWMSFAEFFAEPAPESEDPTDILKWIDEVTTGFAEKFGLVEKLLESVDLGAE